MIEKLLEDKVIELAAHSHKEVYGQKMPKKTEIQIRKKFRAQLKSDEFYTYFQVKNKKVEKLVMAEVIIHEVEPPFIYINPYTGFTHAELKKIISEISDFFKDKHTLSLRAIKSDVNKFKKLGFFCKGVWLRGEVNKSLGQIKDVSSEFTLEPMNYEKDVKTVAKLIIKAHNQCDTVIVQFHDKKQKDAVKTYLKEFCDLNTAIVAKTKRGKIVGIVAHNPNSGVKGTALIAFIAVTPEFQGKGISKLLYKGSLENMQKQKFKFYTGCSSTTEVLSYAKKLKREDVFYVMWKDQK